MTSIVICTPTITKPYAAYLEALENSVPALDAAGIKHKLVFEVGSVYISWTRANMLMKGMETDADAFIFIDHDLSWEPEDLVRLIQQPGDVVAGTYRYKNDEVEYMGTWATESDNRPSVREDGTLIGYAIPAGFLKVTRAAVEKFKAAYPELIFGPKNEFVDLFNHGAHAGKWWGEDFAFARRWRDCGGDIALIPDLNITHHLGETAFPGNLHNFLRHQPGGDLA